MDDGRTRALIADVEEPGRQWHSRERPPQVVSSLEIDTRIVVGNQPYNTVMRRISKSYCIPVYPYGSMAE
jgi:hypothetical protein